LASKILGIPAKIVEAQIEPQASDPRREPIQLPSPRRAREQTRHDWPPPSIPAPGYRSKQESAPEFHVHFEQHQGRPPRGDSMPPKSARERAGDAMRSPIVKVLGILLGAFGAGGGGAVVREELKREQSPVQTPSAGAAYQELKEPLRNLANDLNENDKADRATVDWMRGEISKLNKRVSVCERKFRRDPGDELEPEPPPEAPPPPKLPKLKERL
jgi:hypothetical protein